MKPTSLARLRLSAQGLVPGARSFQTPADVVSHLGALQAQDYEGALWSVGLRLLQAGVPVQREAIEAAVSQRQIVRTWPMRGTLHFVAPADIRWMLQLMTPRSLAASAKRQAQLEIDASVLKRSAEILETELADGQVLSRPALLERLEAGGIATGQQRGYHLLSWHAQKGLICFGPLQGKQPSFVWLESWVPPAPVWERDQALAEIARRFFRGHGPASLSDLMRWTGLTARDSRRGLEQVTGELEVLETPSERYWMAPGQVPAASDSLLLLPGFDEYLLGYKDRSAVLAPEHAATICPGNNGMFMPTLVCNGQVMGIWKRTLSARKVRLHLQPFAPPLPPAITQALPQAATAYGAFLDKPAEWSESP
ncbi:MAG: winged helix DNA-binding domain-containing protein [Candidatus Sericytochromatia bacterium]